MAGFWRGNEGSLKGYGKRWGRGGTFRSPGINWLVKGEQELLLLHEELTLKIQEGEEASREHLGH